MNKEELCDKLNKLNLQYPARIPKDIIADAADSNLVVVYGASDDLMEFEGAINDEVGCYSGGVAHIINGALAFSECSDGEECPYFKKKKLEARKIDAIWDRDEVAWQYETSIPHSDFSVWEDGDEYCRGIVFSLDDLEGDSKELLDCPFCGVEPEIKESFGWKITCPVCKMGTPSEYGATRVAVVKQWNSRKP